MCDIDEEWQNFITNNQDEYNDDVEFDNQPSFEDTEINYKDTTEFDNNISPKCSDIYISTKTKIAYLNNPVDLNKVFWNIPIIEYSQPNNGVVKKQIKLNSNTVEEYNEIQQKLVGISYFEEHIITHIDNPNGRIKFKDTRKISIGLSKKDIMSYRSKKKSAFYNCFVLILRLKIINKFHEYHVKVFNTGKLEIPGVQDDISFNMILQLILDTLSPYVSTIDNIKLDYKDNSVETVLINSNFNCGFYIDREKLYTILKDKYNIQSIFDPCSYPGVQCKFYYNHDIVKQSGCQISKDDFNLYKNITHVSFMVFRTGSVLIVGKCNESVLSRIYEFVKNILHNEFTNICQFKNKHTLNEQHNNLQKKRKIRKKIIINIDE
jgi:hypothetical protein